MATVTVVKPSSPMKEGVSNTYYYPLTDASQVICDTSGNRLDGKISSGELGGVKNLAIETNTTKSTITLSPWTGSAFTVDIPAATASKAGYITADSQTLAGNKTFNGCLLAHSDSSNAWVCAEAKAGKIYIHSSSTNTGPRSIYSTNANGDAQYLLKFDQNGYGTAIRLYNAVWNDYAEYFPRGEDTEPGDIVMLDLLSKEEKYIKAVKGLGPVVGVESDTYGYITGGDKDVTKEENDKNYIPIGMMGRVMVKVKGDIRKGDWIGPSDTPGVGERVLKENAVGFVVDDTLIDGKVKIKLI